MGLLKRSWPLFALLLIEAWLIITNFKSGTFLVGWDNLLPELNFSGNFARNFFAVWQEYRGLGLLDGMAHAATLPHTVFIWFLNLFLPLNFLRYFFVFLMHLVGGIGMYYLLVRLVAANEKQRQLISFLGALFYLLNLATVQMFYAPLEVFLVHFAFLPWLTLYLIKYLQAGLWWDLALFSLFSILAIPQAHVPTVFFVYLLWVFIILFFNLAQNRQLVKRVILLLAAIFFINSYWLLPYLYSAPQNAQVVMDAKINRMSSEEVFLKNKARGGLADVFLMRGFLLDVIEPDRNGNQGYIMASWRQYLEVPSIKAISSLFLLLALGGLVYVLKERKREFYPFVAAFSLSVFFLGSNIWGLRQANEFLREGIPVFAEAFRFSFTKFAILFAFSYTVFFVLGLVFALRYFKKSWQHVFSALMVTLIFLYTLPSFQGHFLFASLRLKIPREYFQSIEFFKSQDRNSRVATFPQPNFWSWRFTNWGYRGSGFLWYGIPQPTLDRAFDPWSGQNENYYWEVSYALYSNKQELFEKVLEKYQVRWVLVDGNTTNPASPKTLYLNEVEEMLSSAKFEKAEEFGKIKIYKVNLETPVKDYMFIAENLPQVAPAYRWSNFDSVFQENGHYISLFTRSAQDDLEFKIEDRGDHYLFVKEFPEKLQGYTVLPQHQDVFFDGEVLAVRVPKADGLYSAEIAPFSKVEDSTSFWLKSLPHNLSYLISIESKNLDGRPLLFWLENLDTKKADIEMYLEQRTQNSRSIQRIGEQRVYYFIQPPMQDDGAGYTLHFENRGVGEFKSENELGKISVNPIPYDFLADVKLLPAKPETLGSVLVYGQAFHPGWQAFYFARNKLVYFDGIVPRAAGRHVLVDNWANGWILSGEARKEFENGKIQMLFLPQALEFIGLSFLGGYLIWLLRKRI